MLLLLGPRYSASQQELDALVASTGLATYDLRTRLRPGAWSVVRAFADAAQARDIATRLQACGLDCCALDSSIGQDPARRIAYLRGVEVEPTQVILRLAERAMKVPLGALLTIVRGDVHLGRMPQATLQTSSASLRSVGSASGVLASGPAASEVFREQRASANQDVFVAADLHFVTVPWLARMDARDCALAGQDPDAANHAERLDHFIDDLAQKARIRVDRQLKISSLASHTAGNQRMATPSPSGPPTARRGPTLTDEHFDAYSRMVGEAERLIYGSR